MSIDQFCNLGCFCGILYFFIGFIGVKQEDKNEKAKLELMKNAGEEPEGYGHAEEFAEVLEDLVDAEHESDPNLNLEESEFAEIIDEDAIEKSKSKSRALFFIIIFIFWTLLIGSDF